MGNIRVSYFKNTNGSAEVLEENNFYPFGMKHEGYNQTTGNPAYTYGYNGKELQKETGWSDYGARMYMCDIGRWGVIDPLAETSRRFTPYNYAYNNPVMFIDPDGRKAVASTSYSPDMYSQTPAPWSPGTLRGGVAAIDELFAKLEKMERDSQTEVGGGGSSPIFQFPKGTEEYYKKNYPAFYNLVKNILPNILKDPNYLKALMDVTGMSKETLEKAFNYGGDSPIIHADHVWGDGFYDYSGSHAKEDINTVSVDIDKVLNWYEKANKDPNTIAGVANIFYMTAVVGHEAAHWGNQIKGPTGEGLNFLHNFNNLAGEPEHGNAFEFKLLNGLYPNAKVGNFLYIGHASSGLSQYLNNYVSTNFKMLSNIFKQK